MQSEAVPGPLHAAIIMDGNGRWATQRGLPRLAGHHRGVESIRRTAEACPDLGIGTLTLYAFSADNWQRPAEEVGGLMRLQAAARVVHERARGSDARELPRLLGELRHRALVAGAVDEAGVELLAQADDRLAGLAQVGDVVERVVQAEDVDPVLGRARDEAADEVGPDRPRADEEAAAKRDPERRRRTCLQRADPLPRALHAAAHGTVEHAAAGHLERSEAGAVQDLGEVRALTLRGSFREGRLSFNEPIEEPELAGAR